MIGPVTVAALFGQLFAIDDQLRAVDRYDQRLQDAHDRLVGALSLTRQDAFVPVLVANARTDDPQRVGLLAHLLARHGGDSGNSNPPINAVHRADLHAVVERWTETLRMAPQPARHAASEVASAVGRLTDAGLAEPLYALLERDLADYASARKARLAARGRGTHDDMGYTRMYAHAFATMHDAPAVAVLTRSLGDLRWGIDAAGALFEIWSSNRPPKEKQIFGGWTDYSHHLSRRAGRAAGNPAHVGFCRSDLRRSSHSG